MILGFLGHMVQGHLGQFEGIFGDRSLHIGGSGDDPGQVVVDLGQFVALFRVLRRGRDGFLQQVDGPSIVFLCRQVDKLAALLLLLGAISGQIMLASQFSFVDGDEGPAIAKATSRPPSTAIIVVRSGSRAQPPDAGGTVTGRASISLPSRNRCKSSANRAAETYRLWQSFSRHFRQIVSRSRGTKAFRFEATEHHSPRPDGEAN